MKITLCEKCHGTGFVRDLILLTDKFCSCDKGQELYNAQVRIRLPDAFKREGFRVEFILEDEKR